MLKRNCLVLTSALILSLLVGTAVTGQEPTAQEIKPIVTVAFSGYGDLISDLNFVGNLAGNPQLGAAVDMMAMMGTGGHEFKSLDRSKPWGALVFADGGAIRILGFVPLANLEELKAILEANAVELEEADGVVTASVNDQNVYLKSEGGWVFLGNQAEVLGKLPKDPVAALKGLEKAYNLAVRVDMQNLPGEFRDMLLGGLADGPAVGLGAKVGRVRREICPSLEAGRPKPGRSSERPSMNWMRFSWDWPSTRKFPRSTSISRQPPWPARKRPSGSWRPRI